MWVVKVHLVKVWIIRLLLEECFYFLLHMRMYCVYIQITLNLLHLE